MSELTSSLILTYLIHSSVLIVALWILDRTAALRDPLLRERLWRAALIVPVISASLQVAAPELALAEPVPVEHTRFTIAPEPQVSEPMQSPLPTAGAIPAQPQPTATAIEFDPRTLLVWLWLLLATWLLARTIVSVIRGRNMLRDRRTVRDHDAVPELASLVGQAGVAPVRLSISTATPGPLTLPRREICLPVRALSLPRAELRGMLAHELAHVVRGDAIHKLVTTVFCAAFCIQPLNFLVRRRLTECAEINADDWASRLVGEGHSLARCLVTVATWLEPSRAPAFAAAMAESDRGLLGRVRRLADGSPDANGWRGRGSVIALLVLATLVVPGVVFTSIDGSSATSISHRDDGSFSVNSRDANGTLRVRATGTVRFTADERGIEHLEPGRELWIISLDHRTDGLEHELRVRADANGRLEYEYEVDGDEQSFELAGREWLAGILPRLFRATGIQAAERVARIHARGGVDAVLEEIELISSDFVARVYFVELAALDDIEPADRVRVYRLAGESIGSDFELRQALEAFPLRRGSTPEEARALLAAARSIGSDFESAELLISVAPHLPVDDSVVAAFVETAAEIGSDFELGRVLKSTIRAPWATGDALSDLLVLSAEISSDFEHAGFLIDVAPRVLGNGEAQQRYLEAAAEVSSDFELARVLVAFLSIDGIDSGTVGRVLELAQSEIGSDFEMLRVLKAAAPLVSGNPSLRAQYEQAAESLSDFEYREAMRAL